MKIVISPYSQKLRPPKQNDQNPKNYPYWKELIELLKDHEIIQVGVNGEPRLVSDTRFNWPLVKLKELISECDFWIAVDNFFPHLAYHVSKRGVGLWGPSDPLIFGYPTNVNILKGKEYLRPDQFKTWEECDLDPNRFVSAEEVYNTVNKEFNMTK